MLQSVKLRSASTNLELLSKLSPRFQGPYSTSSASISQNEHTLVTWVSQTPISISERDASYFNVMGTQQRVPDLGIVICRTASVMNNMVHLLNKIRFLFSVHLLIWIESRIKRGLRSCGNTTGVRITYSFSISKP